LFWRGAEAQEKAQTLILGEQLFDNLIAMSLKRLYQFE